MARVFLKTYCYAPHEIEFIRANLEECYPYVEKMIVCEFDVNHTGMKRDYKFENIRTQIPTELMDKFDYHACAISDSTVKAYNDEGAIHRINEPVMRSWFTKLYDFAPDDIIISVDADEIIDGDKIKYIIEEVKIYGTIRLKLRQFFYKKNYLWKNKYFVSPIATYFSSIKPGYPNNWRDQGIITEDFVGAHFSWCMSPKEMVHKLYTYSHPRYRFCADEEFLREAIENKKYPFDENVQFDIEELDSDDTRIPKSMRRL